MNYIGYTVIGAFFPEQGKSEQGEKDFKDKLFTEKIMDPIINSSFTATKKIFEIFDPHEGQPKDLVIIVKDNSTGEIMKYRFPEQVPSRKVTITIP